MAEAFASAELPPWLQAPWGRLWRARTQGRLGHAWLLTGIAGLGKRLFADHLTQSLLCRQPGHDGIACGVCDECHLFISGNHPDSQRVGPSADSASGEIPVGSIREMANLENLTPHRGRHKVIRIDPADAMNRSAANSLLKTLEEPTSTTVLLLIANDANQLPATIRSRCQQLIFVPPAESESLPWLERQIASPQVSHLLLLRLAQGAPLRVHDVMQSGYLSTRDKGVKHFLAVANGQQDPLSAAAAWQALDLTILINAAVGWLCDIARLHCDPTTTFVNNPDLREDLQQLALRLSAEGLHRFHAQMQRARVLLQSPVNRQLLSESLMIRWALLADARVSR